MSSLLVGGGNDRSRDRGRRRRSRSRSRSPNRDRGGRGGGRDRFRGANRLGFKWTSFHGAIYFHIHVCVYTNLHSPRTVELSKILSYLIMSNLTFNWSCSLTKNLAMSFTCIKLLFLLVGLPLLQNEGERGMNYCNIHCTLLELLFQAYVFWIFWI